MIKKKHVKSAVFIAFTAMGTLWADDGGKGLELMKKIDNRPDGDDRTMTMTMKLINKKGKERVRTMTLYSKDYGKDSKSLFYFEKPADVKGTGFLTWGYDNPDKDDDRWLYLPALKRSRRISGASKNDSFMGSDMSYDDMGNRSVDEDVHTFLKEEVFDGHSCWVIQSVSKDPKYQYSRVVQWYRKDALLSVKVEFYDRKGALLKNMLQSDIKKVKDFWVAHKIEVKNVQKNHKTILEMSNVSFNSDLKDNLFKVATLERGVF